MVLYDDDVDDDYDDDDDDGDDYDDQRKCHIGCQHW